MATYLFSIYPFLNFCSRKTAFLQCWNLKSRPLFHLYNPLSELHSFPSTHTEKEGAPWNGFKTFIFRFTFFVARYKKSSINVCHKPVFNLMGFHLKATLFQFPFGKWIELCCFMYILPSRSYFLSEKLEPP